MSHCVSLQHHSKIFQVSGCVGVLATGFGWSVSLSPSMSATGGKSLGDLAEPTQPIHICS